jgi:2-amino-4-hydroxy-6-hydroxymethyldihydropteridine diphosphokinase
MTAVRVHVSVGSNEDPRLHIPRGLAALERTVGPLLRSPVYRNPAVGFAGEDFFNLVVSFETILPLDEIAQCLRDIERTEGRTRGEARFAPRTLDLDVLTYGTACIETERLRLPRADILEYAFVLKPLADNAPDEAHPVLGQSYATLWAAFDKSGLVLDPAPDFPT